MTIASIADVKAKLSSYVNASGKSPVVITRNGKAVAAIVPLAEDEDLERLMLSHSPKLRAILASSHKQIRDGAGISHEDFWADIASPSLPKRKRKA